MARCYERHVFEHKVNVNAMNAAKMGTGKNSAHRVLEAPDAVRGQNSCLSPFLPPPTTFHRYQFSASIS